MTTSWELEVPLLKALECILDPKATVEERGKAQEVKLLIDPKFLIVVLRWLYEFKRLHTSGSGIH